MEVDVLTIFPEMFAPVLGVSILKRAQERGALTVRVRDLRDFTRDRHRSVDDRPYGGGPGMVMKPEPIFAAVEELRRACASHQAGGCETILLSPRGERLTAASAQALAARRHLILVCGHYEGVDERVRLALVDRELSIGDYVLTGGELPALVVIDCVARFLPDVIGHEDATREESFASGWLEYPQYTRPPAFRGLAVPDVLLSGDHEEVAAWRRLQSVERTLAVRPDLAPPPRTDQPRLRGQQKG